MSEERSSSSESYIQLSVNARATVHAIQGKKEGSGAINWSVLARDLHLTVGQLKALSKIHLPEKSNKIPLRSLPISD